MPSRWYYLIKGTDEETGEEIKLLDWQANYIADLPKTVTRSDVLFHLNEIIARINDWLGWEEKRAIPFLETCRVCGEVTTDNHMVSYTGVQSEGGISGPNTCDRCSRK